MKAKLLWGVLALFLSGGGYVAYEYFLAPSASFQAIYLVPKDAIYIIETNEPIDNWTKVSNAGFWKHLRKNAYFASLTESANTLDTMIQNNRAVFDLVGSRQVLLSAHIKPGRKDYDFLYIVDLQKASKLSNLQEYLTSLSGAGMKVTKRAFKNRDIIELYDTKSKDRLSLALVENLLVCSYTHTLVENAISQMEDPVLGRDLNFIDVSRVVDGEGMCRVYMQYAFLDDYMRCYLDESNEYVNDISEQLLYSGLKLDISDEGLMSMSGFTNVNQEEPSYVQALLASGRGSIELTDMAPQRTAFYMGLGFGDFSSFYDEVEKNMQADTAAYNEYKANTQKLEKFLRISLKDNFMSWVDDELAFVQTQPVGLGKDNEFAVILKAKDIDDATENLNFIGDQIRKRTPVKFKGIDYKGYPIKFMSVKGFFKLLLGKFFSKLEKPYYTIIDDCVIFSNHPQTLKSMIDDYIAGKTLGKQPEFEAFKAQFNSESNLFMYVQTPVLHENMRPFVSAETWGDMQKNKEFIVCFSQMGFQLTGNGSGFDTKMLVQYQDPELIKQQEAEARAAKDAILNQLQTEDPNDSTGTLAMLQNVTFDDIVAIEDISLDDLDAKIYSEKYGDGKPKLEVSMRDGFRNGSYTEYYPSGEVKISGKYKNDKKEGVWKEYGEDGKVIKKVKYRNGEAVN